MKNIFIIIIFGVVFSACDFVNNPTNVEPAMQTNNGSIVLRKVLLEDYTGHKCGQCPPAAEELHRLDSLYPHRIVGLAVHAGFFAGVTPGLYPTDFRTTEGTDYNTTFGVTAYPNGLVNRKDFKDNSIVKAWSSWSSETNLALNSSAKFQIKIKNAFNATTSMLSSSVTVKSLATNAGTFKLVLLLSEDSIKAEQKDDRYTPNIISNYTFNHVLRGAINSNWGDALLSGTAIANDSIVKNYSNFTINGAYKSKNCKVIAFVYDADPSSPSYYEVLQVEEEKID